MTQPQDRGRKPNPFIAPPKADPRDWFRPPPPAQPQREWIEKIRGKGIK